MMIDYWKFVGGKFKKFLMFELISFWYFMLKEKKCKYEDMICYIIGIL